MATDEKPIADEIIVFAPVPYPEGGELVIYQIWEEGRQTATIQLMPGRVLTPMDDVSRKQELERLVPLFRRFPLKSQV